MPAEGTTTSKQQQSVESLRRQLQDCQGATIHLQSQLEAVRHHNTELRDLIEHLVKTNNESQSIIKGLRQQIAIAPRP